MHTNPNPAERMINVRPHKVRKKLQTGNNNVNADSFIIIINVYGSGAGFDQT